MYFCVYGSFFKYREQNYAVLYVYDSFSKYPKQNYALLYVYDSLFKYPEQNLLYFMCMTIASTRSRNIPNKTSP